MKKLTALFLAMVLVLGVAACGNTEETVEPETVGQHLVAAFEEDSEGSAQEIADRLITHEVIAFAGATMPVEPGFLMGFDNEITGFEEAVMFSPMIGTIPFMGYVFVLEDGADVDAFKTTLEENANLCWNICTEAEELNIASEGNTVMFVMSPMDFEDTAE